VQHAGTRTLASSCSNFPLRSAQQGPSARDSRRPQLQLTSTKTAQSPNSIRIQSEDVLGLIQFWCRSFVSLKKGTKKGVPVDRRFQ
jgi:hypothetical protein